MITLAPLNETQYKVVIDQSDLEYDDFLKLLRKRDKFPAEWVKSVEELLPANQSMQSYDHFSMILTING
jgi:hypothetical protein